MGIPEARDQEMARPVYDAGPCCRRNIVVAPDRGEPIVLVVEREPPRAWAIAQDDVLYLSTAHFMGPHIWSEPGSQAVVRVRSDGIPLCTRTIRLFLRKRD